MKKNLDIVTAESWCYGEGGQVEIGWDDNNEPIYGTLSSSEIQANCNKYGRLYTWAAARTVCPNGWHLPTSEEGVSLGDHVGGREVAGKKLKAGSGWNWNDDDNVSGNGTDEFGFSALPGGRRLNDGTFIEVGERGRWWTATESRNNDQAVYFQMYYNHNEAGDGTYTKSGGHSVRCVQ